MVLKSRWQITERLSFRLEDEIYGWFDRYYCQIMLNTIQKFNHCHFLILRRQFKWLTALAFVPTSDVVPLSLNARHKFSLSSIHCTITGSQLTLGHHAKYADKSHYTNLRIGTKPVAKKVIFHTLLTPWRMAPRISIYHWIMSYEN
jgi:hypothetical protein